MKLNNYIYDEIFEGMSFEFEREFMEKDLQKFGELTEDFNPLHTSSEFARKNGFKNKVVYGMLAGSLFSTLVGMVCPGENNLYLSQSLNFRRPIYLGDKLVIKGKVVNKTECIKVVTIKTEILSDNSIKVEGFAKVKVIENG